MDLFEASTQDQSLYSKPLAEELRPQLLKDFVGQKKVLGESSPLMRIILSSKHVPNLILWGPPGTGKTSFANLLSSIVEADFIIVNAVDTGAKKLREIGEHARNNKIQFQRATVLFVDEIHRLNKSQQDVLLPFSERGDFSLVGATTENPSYELNSALLSRCRVVLFKKLEKNELQEIFVKACLKKDKKHEEILTAESRELLIQYADGDARRLLNLLELVFNFYNTPNNHWVWPLAVEDFQKMSAGSPIYYDKKGDEHYNCISAFIKSIRGSSPDAAVYYLARMLEGGEDPIFIARRLVISASEDIGNADPRALTLAVSGLEAVRLVGMPEARISLAQVTTYLASAPKSNKSYLAINKALAEVKESGQLPIPNSLKSGASKLEKSLGFGDGYKYSHLGAKGWTDQEFLPPEIKDQVFYEPVERGFEKNIKNYLAWVKS